MHTRREGTVTEKSHETSTVWFLALALLVFCTPTASVLASDSSRLFVLVSNDRTLRDIENVAAQISIPVQVLDLSAVSNITTEINESLAFVNDMNEEQVIEHEQDITRGARAALKQAEPALSAAYRHKIMAGEMTKRYGIDTTPAVIEIDADGRYRLVQGPSSLRAAIVAIDRMPYLTAPPPLFVPKDTAAGSQR